MEFQSDLQVRYNTIQIRILDALRRVSCEPPALQARKITLIAVSKYQPVEAIEELYHLGHRDFGENYVQELVEKALELRKRNCPEIRWHMIGHLQTNKIKKLIQDVSVVHTVDSEKLALALAQRWSESGRHGRMPVFIQINLDKEINKTGINPDEAASLAQRLSKIPELELQGLMGVPSAHSDSRPRFALLRKIEGKCHPYSRGALSMGMSNDFEAAIEEGATHIRIGTLLFGERRTVQ